MSKSRKRSHPNLRGPRTHDETAAIWQLAAEGRDPEEIAKAFPLDAAGLVAVADWQASQGIAIKPTKYGRACEGCRRC